MAMRLAMAKCTSPTGLASEPPPGPAMPVTATERLALDCTARPPPWRAPSAFDTAPCSSMMPRVDAQHLGLDGIGIGDEAALQMSDAPAIWRQIGCDAARPCRIPPSRHQTMLAAKVEQAFGFQASLHAWSIPPWHFDGRRGHRGDTFAAAGKAEPSVVVALTLTRPGSMPQQFRHRRAASPRVCGPIFGRSQISVTSTLTMRAAASASEPGGMAQELAGIARPSIADRWAGNARRCRPRRSRRARRRSARAGQHRRLNAPQAPAHAAMAMPHNIDMAARFESMHVEPRAGAHFARRGGRVRQAGAPPCSKSSGVVSLMLRSDAQHERDSQPVPFGDRGVIGEIFAARERRGPMRFENGREMEPLRRLGAPQPVAGRWCASPVRSPRPSAYRQAAKRRGTRSERLQAPRSPGR